MVGLVVGLMLGLAGCAGTDPDDRAAGGTSVTESVEPPADSAETSSGSVEPTGEPVSTTNPALDFAATDLDGTPITGVEGDAVLWFWAPWCPICTAEAPVIAGAVTDNPDVTFIGVAGLDELAAIEAFPGETGTEGFRHVADLEGVIWSEFGVISQPSMALITADGTVKVISGAMAPQDVQDKIDKYLG